MQIAYRDYRYVDVQLALFVAFVVPVEIFALPVPTWQDLPHLSRSIRDFLHFPQLYRMGNYGPVVPLRS